MSISSKNTLNDVPHRDKLEFFYDFASTNIDFLWPASDAKHSNHETLVKKYLGVSTDEEGLAYAGSSPFTSTGWKDVSGKGNHCRLGFASGHQRIPCATSGYWYFELWDDVLGYHPTENSIKDSNYHASNRELWKMPLGSPTSHYHKFGDVIANYEGTDYAYSSPNNKYEFNRFKSRWVSTAHDDPRTSDIGAIVAPDGFSTYANNVIKAVHRTNNASSWNLSGSDRTDAIIGLTYNKHPDIDQYGLVGGRPATTIYATIDVYEGEYKEWRVVVNDKETISTISDGITLSPGDIVATDYGDFEIGPAVMFSMAHPGYDVTTYSGASHHEDQVKAGPPTRIMRTWHAIKPTEYNTQYPQPKWTVNHFGNPPDLQLDNDGVARMIPSNDNVAIFNDMWTRHLNTRFIYSSAGSNWNTTWQIKQDEVIFDNPTITTNGAGGNDLMIHFPRKRFTESIDLEEGDEFDIYVYDLNDVLLGWYTAIPWKEDYTYQDINDDYINAQQGYNYANQLLQDEDDVPFYMRPHPTYSSTWSDGHRGPNGGPPTKSYVTFLIKYENFTACHYSELIAEQVGGGHNTQIPNSSNNTINMYRESHDSRPFLRQSPAHLHGRKLSKKYFGDFVHDYDYDRSDHPTSSYSNVMYEPDEDYPFTGVFKTWVVAKRVGGDNAGDKATWPPVKYSDTTGIIPFLGSSQGMENVAINNDVHFEDDERGPGKLSAFAWVKIPPMGKRYGDSVQRHKPSDHNRQTAPFPIRYASEANNEIENIPIFSFKHWDLKISRDVFNNVSEYNYKPQGRVWKDQYHGVWDLNTFEAGWNPGKLFFTLKSRIGIGGGPGYEKTNKIFNNFGLIHDGANNYPNFPYAQIIDASTGFGNVTGNGSLTPDELRLESGVPVFHNFSRTWDHYAPEIEMGIKINSYGRLVGEKGNWDDVFTIARRSDDLHVAKDEKDYIKQDSRQGKYVHVGVTADESTGIVKLFINSKKVGEWDFNLVDTDGSDINLLTETILRQGTFSYGSSGHDNGFINSNFKFNTSYGAISGDFARGVKVWGDDLDHTFNGTGISIVEDWMEDNVHLVETADVGSACLYYHALTDQEVAQLYKATDKFSRSKKKQVLDKPIGRTTPAGVHPENVAYKLSKTLSRKTFDEADPQSIDYLLDQEKQFLFAAGTKDYIAKSLPCRPAHTENTQASNKSWNQSFWAGTGDGRWGFLGPKMKGGDQYNGGSFAPSFLGWYGSTYWEDPFLDGTPPLMTQETIDALMSAENSTAPNPLLPEHKLYAADANYLQPTMVGFRPEQINSVLGFESADYLLARVAYGTPYYGSTTQSSGGATQARGKAPTGLPYIGIAMWDETVGFLGTTYMFFYHRLQNDSYSQAWASNASNYVNVPVSGRQQNGLPYNPNSNDKAPKFSDLWTETMRIAQPGQGNNDDNGCRNPLPIEGYTYDVSGYYEVNGKPSSVDNPYITKTTNTPDGDNTQQRWLLSSNYIGNMTAAQQSEDPWNTQTGTMSYSGGVWGWKAGETVTAPTSSPHDGIWGVANFSTDGVDSSAGVASWGPNKTYSSNENVRFFCFMGRSPD